MAVSATTSGLLRRHPAAPLPVKLAARALKVTLVLDPAAVAAALRPHEHSDDRTLMEIAVEGRTVRCDFAPKAIRKALGLIRAHGPEGVAVIIQGKLVAGDRITEAGLVAQPKTPKPAEQEAA